MGGLYDDAPKQPDQTGGLLGYLSQMFGAQQPQGVLGGLSPQMPGGQFAVGNPMGEAYPPGGGDMLRKVGSGMAQGLADWVSRPARAMQEGVTTGQAADWAAPTAFGMIAGARLPGGAPAGALGSSGARLVQPEGIRAYHGSPHDFDAFDLSKIGTGEGAQAYGHGLYFAENEGVARSYRDALTASHNRRSVVVNVPGNPFSGAQILEADPTRPGRMYEVNIGAKPEQFLDWDKPLYQQGPKAADAFKNITKMDLEPPTVQTGAPNAGQFIQSMGRMVGDERVSHQLNEAGIPGIRYLDQGSRGAGTGSSNYVVFNPSIIDILRKYGIAGLSTAGAGGLLANNQPQQ